MHVLVVNAGSSSLKLRVLDPDGSILASSDGRTDGMDDAIRAISGSVEIDAVGHRVVHGGDRFTSSVTLDDDVRREIEALSDLAPLHQPLSLGGIDAAARVLPHAPAVACFDTAFHADLPAAAATYAIPDEWRRDHNVKRYGFHGLSHAYASRRAAEIVGRPIADLRIVTCHLGAGASLAAVAAGRSVDTTMGFTPLEGLVMATRSGNLDPGAILWLQQRKAMTSDEIHEALEHRSGLLALAGTPDMGEVVGRASGGDERALLALDIYVHRLTAGIAAMTAAMGGVDVIVFTGGVGENSTQVREMATARLAFLGESVRTLVVEAREDLEIAREVRTVVGTAGGERE